MLLCIFGLGGFFYLYYKRPRNPYGLGKQITELFKPDNSDKNATKDTEGEEKLELTEVVTAAEQVSEEK